MNIFLWILQILLAFHTAMGAVWKLSNSEQTVPSLAALPHEAWLAMIVIEFLICVGLILPALKKSLGFLVPLAAAGVAVEMLIFTVFHINSGETDNGPMIYWLVVAAICGFIAYARLALKPLQ